MWVVNEHDFVEQMGCPYVDVADNRYFLNGGSWSFREGCGTPPSSDEHECIKQQVVYAHHHRERCQRYVDQVETNLLAAIELASYNAGPLPSEQSVECLRLLKYDLELATQRLLELQGCIALSDDNIHQRMVAQRRDAHKAKAAKLQAQIVKMK